jgi:hypothetical protein
MKQKKNGKNLIRHLHRRIFFFKCFSVMKCLRSKKRLNALITTTAAGTQVLELLHISEDSESRQRGPMARRRGNPNLPARQPELSLRPQESRMTASGTVATHCKLCCCRCENGLLTLLIF